MPKRTTDLAAAAAVLLLTLTGCAGTPDAAPESPNEAKSFSAPVTTETEAPADPEEPAIGYGPTGAGEVCDPGNGNDAICAAFYPDQAALNATSAPRALEPLASMSDAEKIGLAKQACEVLNSGGSAEGVVLVETVVVDSRPADWNAGLPFAAGTLAYCTEHLDAKPRALLDHYVSLGEEASKAEFADGSMPSL